MHPMLSRVSLPVVAWFLTAAGTAAQEVTRVDVSPAQTSVAAGETARFTAVAYDEAGRPMEDVDLMWLATPFDIAGVDGTGELSTFRPGRVFVLAIAGGVPGMAAVDITERPPAELSIHSPAGDEAVVGGTLQLATRAATEIGDPVETAPPSWRSSDPSVAAVDAAGLVSARSPGEAVITATLGDLTSTFTVRVRENPVRSVEIASVGSPVRTGDVVALRATARDADGSAVTDVPLRWSVAGTGASIGADGRFVATDPGSYTVFATAGSVAASTAITAVRRASPWRMETVAHVPLPGDVQATELWPVGDVVYVATLGDRLYVFDISDPASPVLTDSLMVDARLINDVATTADGRVGVLAREGASTRRNGIVLFDASDPRHPSILAEYTEGLTGGVHSTFVDGDHVYATDDATGSLRIIDISDPSAPRQVARWQVEREEIQTYAVDFLNVSPQRYLHDVYVEDGIAYLAYWRDGLVLLDVGNGIRGGRPDDPVLITRYTYNHAELYPPGFIAGTHTMFTAGRYIFIGDESYPGTTDLHSREQFPTRGRIHVLDRSDITDLRKVAEYDPVEFGAHNLWVLDDLLYMGAYTGGLRVLDVGGELRGDLREQGREVASLFTGTLDGFRPNTALAWGAIPHRGFVFATDINTGLWVTRMTRVPVP